jgi:hypothetical protein
MKVGTKSVLFGAHCFFIHPIVVAIAWWKLYGFPRDPRIWIAFIVHDWGYWGKPNMDGEEGETHVELGARIMSKLFDPKCVSDITKYKYWYNFTLYHSRFYAKANNHPISQLCVADKFAFCCEPKWFYLLRATASGEIKEYMNPEVNRQKHGYIDKNEWYNRVYRFMLKWTEENKNSYYKIND